MNYLIKFLKRTNLMPTQLHFINVGQGNMTLLQLDDGKVFLYDCNVTNENEGRILEYLANKIGRGKPIDTFICSHRDADHMRGVKKIHKYFPIKLVWDSGVTGTTPNSTEYLEYMELRRSIGFNEIKAKTYYDYKNTRLRIMNSKNDALANNANAQSIVIKVVHRNSILNIDHDSVMLTGDTDAVTWKHISQNYGKNDLSCSLLLASHHGSISYFNDSSQPTHYTNHLYSKSPDMTIISVGNNSHGHPNDTALMLYEKYTKGSQQKNKILRTDKHGSIHLTLKDGGSWSLKRNV